MIFCLRFLKIQKLYPDTIINIPYLPEKKKPSEFLLLQRLCINLKNYRPEEKMGPFDARMLFTYRENGFVNSIGIFSLLYQLISEFKQRIEHNVVFILGHRYTNLLFLLMKSEHPNFLLFFLFFIFSPIIQQARDIRKCANYILFPVSITVCMRGLCMRKGNKKRDTSPQPPQKGRLIPCIILLPYLYGLLLS